MTTPAFDIASWAAEATRYWATPIIAASIGAYIYTRRQRAANRHVLHALWEETRLVNYDCLQWAAGYDGEALGKNIRKDSSYRPYTFNYRSSKGAIEKLMSDMPGVEPQLVRLGMHYHYDDANATSAIAAINSDLWKEYSTQQRLYVIEDADKAMLALNQSSYAFHEKLSQELQMAIDTDVFEKTVPEALRI